MLTQAVQNGHFDIVKLLVENGANADYEEEWSDGKKTAVDVAKQEDSKHIIDVR